MDTLRSCTSARCICEIEQIRKYWLHPCRDFFCDKLFSLTGIDWVNSLDKIAEQPDRQTSQVSMKFTVRTLFVLLTVTAVSAACFGGLVNAATKNIRDISLFIPVTAAAPLALMVLMNYLLKLGDWLFGRRQSRN